MTLTVELSWPASALWPNAASPGNWRRKQTAAKAYKADCAILCRAGGLRKIDGLIAAHLTILFNPPDRRRRDLDGMLASFKQGIDAISEAIGLDDYHFSYTIRRDEPVKGGRVVVHITECG